MGTEALPFMKFYPKHWQADAGLRICSLAARGLWLEMLMLMHQSPEYGHLVVPDRHTVDTYLAILTGSHQDQIVELLAELESHEVFSRNGKGVIYSRRMTEDHKKANNARKNGKKGGNPSLLKQREKSPPNNPPDKTPDKGRVKPRIQNTESRLPPNPPSTTDEPPPVPPRSDGHAGGSEHGGSPPTPSDRKAQAREIVTAFYGSIVEHWGEEHRKLAGNHLDFQTALDMVDLGASIELCAEVFDRVNGGFAARELDPPRYLKARLEDVRKAVAEGRSGKPGSHPNLVRIAMHGTRAQRAEMRAIQQAQGEAAAEAWAAQQQTGDGS